MDNNSNEEKGGFIIHNYSPGNQFIQTQNNYYYGNVYQGKAETEYNGFSDEHVAKALEACVGKDKVIDTKWKWAGGYWYLRWACNYPVDPQKFCEKIGGLPFKPEILCDYRNIREYTTLSFLDQDSRKMDLVKPSKNDEKVFAQIREIALKLAEELGKTYLPKD